jgi:hypothetical protein
VLNHDHPPAVKSLAESWLLEGRWLAANGRDPASAFSRSELLSRRALALTDGKSSEALYLLAELHWRRAGWRVARGLGAAADLREGLAQTTRALEETPDHARGAAVQGALELLVARTAATSADRVAAAVRAAASFEKAFAINANLAREYGPLKAEAARRADEEKR